MNVYLGNEAPHEVFPADVAPEDATEVFRTDENGAATMLLRKADHAAGNPTHLDLPAGNSPLDDLREAVGVWAFVSSAPPSWVAAEDDDTAQLLARQFDCEVRDYDEVCQDVAALTGAQA